MMQTLTTIYTHSYFKFTYMEKEKPSASQDNLTAELRADLELAIATLTSVTEQLAVKEKRVKELEDNEEIMKTQTVIANEVAKDTEMELVTLRRKYDDSIKLQTNNSQVKSQEVKEWKEKYRVLHDEHISHISKADVMR